MRIAVIGMGNVGGTLGRRWAKAGHTVVFGSRKPDDAKAKADASAMGASLASIRDAASTADVVVLTVPWDVAPDALRSAGDLSGKVLLDCTNPLLPDLSGLSVGPTTSGGEEAAKLAPGAWVVKIFNSTGFGNMADPNYGGTPATMLYAGDNPAAKEIAARLARDLGFDPVDFGPLTGARLLEHIALAWINLAVKQKMGLDFSLNVVRRPR
jgi:predicted dinucleotide-binding enzyme